VPRTLSCFSISIDWDTVSYGCMFCIQSKGSSQWVLRSPAMTFRIEAARDWGEYRDAWTECMHEQYWFWKPKPLDFNREEELEELETDFGKQDHLFLLARHEGHTNVLGILGLKVVGETGVIRRWEPSVIASQKETGLGRALLGQGLTELSNRSVANVYTVIKYPKAAPGTLKWHSDLFDKSGFRTVEPMGAVMLQDLDARQIRYTAPEGVAIQTGEEFADRDLARLTVKAFTSTAEDRAIHGYDEIVTQPEPALKSITSLRAARLGRSPNDLWKVAIVSDEPAGVVGAFILERQHQPKTGVLGPVGVLPELRRQGIATALVLAQLKSLKDYGCSYALVGTPAANIGAIAMYKGTGFADDYRQVTLGRDL